MLDMYSSLALIYLEKLRITKLQDAGVTVPKDVLARTARAEASRKFDPALWRLAIAYAQSKCFIDETHVLALAQCAWSRHLHIDYVARCGSREKCKDVMILQMSNFDSELNIGGVTHQHHEGFSLSIFRKPTIVVAHLAFKSAALAYYFLANWLSSSFIVQFLIILTLLSMDFWTVKNITGRLLVGLRWWNFVDENGNNHWKFESAKVRSWFLVLDCKEGYNVMHQNYEVATVLTSWHCLWSSMATKSADSP
ncbi:unnamed protein product [Angiostrongylus costaricensis]|uniref:Golgi apparatus membrane protein TVP23 homolog n=1 Tax=Angiostrongylus costaricensis TaxID=334426 RepID=A0A158PK12_ANGCS|nr:unnamed protein product [Angiostrongylus costaricensis]